MNHTELALAGFEAFNRGDIDGVVKLLHPEVEVHSAGEMGEEGTYYGRQGFLDWLQIWLEAWSEYVVELEDLEVVDEENVLVFTRGRGRGKGSGVEVEQPGIFLFTVRDALAVRLHLYADRESALAAARS